MFLSILFLKVEIFSNFFKLSNVTRPIKVDWTIDINCVLDTVSLSRIFGLFLKFNFRSSRFILNKVVNFWLRNWFWFNFRFLGRFLNRLYFYCRLRLLFRFDWSYRFFLLWRWCSCRWLVAFSRLILSSFSSGRWSHSTEEQVIDILFEIVSLTIGIES